jgi:hypothetical protein
MVGSGAVAVIRMVAAKHLKMWMTSHNLTNRSKNMSEVVADKNIPREIKKFNWGAFFLTSFWSIRHGVWVGLLAVLSFFGLIMGLFLGFKGNALAWERNMYTSTEEFMFSQKMWGVVGVLFWLLFFGVFVYSVFFSGTIKTALELVNDNEQAIEYFGSPIKKRLIFINSVSSYKTLNLAKIEAKVGVEGYKQKGYVFIRALKENKVWSIKELILMDNKQNIKRHLIEHDKMKEEFLEHSLNHRGGFHE